MIMSMDAHLQASLKAANAHQGAVQGTGRSTSPTSRRPASGVLDLAAAGVGHVAILREPGRPTPALAPEPGELPSPDGPALGEALIADAADDVDAADPELSTAGLSLDAADLELALRYLPDYRVARRRGSPRRGRAHDGRRGRTLGGRRSSIVVVAAGSTAPALPETRPCSKRRRSTRTVRSRRWSARMRPRSTGAGARRRRSPRRRSGGLGGRRRLTTSGSSEPNSRRRDPAAAGAASGGLLGRYRLDQLRPVVPDVVDEPADRPDPRARPRRSARAGRGARPDRRARGSSQVAHASSGTTTGIRSWRSAIWSFGPRS